MNGARGAAAIAVRLSPRSGELLRHHVDGAPAVAYAVPGAGERRRRPPLPLAPIPIGEPAWWAEAAATLPVALGWTGRATCGVTARYEVVVRYDSLNGAGQLALRDSTSREWSLGRVPSPATRVLWLDRARARLRVGGALSTARSTNPSLYDETVRTAAFHPRPPRRGTSHRDAHRHRPHVSTIRRARVKRA